MSFFLLFLFHFALRADFAVPPLTGPVVDQAQMLRPETREELARFLRQIFAQHGAQIQVATVPDLGDLSIEEASIKITDQWKLGKKKEDRGVLFLLAAKEHRVRIEVGQGLEGDLPDATSNRIIQEVVIPQLKRGSADRAITDGVMAIVHYTDPQLLADDAVPVPRHQQPGSPIRKWLTVLFWLLMFLFFILPSSFARRRGLAGAIFLGGGGWGGGGFGGGSGGGWSGGGGGFSGGGSSGSW